jgi:tagaturonate reductase
MTVLPRLSRDLLRQPPASDVAFPPPEVLELPEKVVQFGTGAFLRGFVDSFIDEANRRGQFGGRIVAVSSTGSGRDDALNAQNGLYTLITRGVEQGIACEGARVIASVSRALCAQEGWGEVLAVARRPEIAFVFSNTTEVGIALDDADDFALAPPRSFPGKLTRFLFERGRHYDFDASHGITVIPCELIERNGDRLREIVLTLGERWRLGDVFAQWVREAVPFCNTLVDRIVPGTPNDPLTLGYRDDLVTVCEPYRLFAIEATELPFDGTDPGIVLTPDVRPFRERKVRLLNGAHTLLAPVALLSGCETVREAMEHELVGRFARRLIFDEIGPIVDAPDAEIFAREVVDRFLNPYIRHALLDITFQATTKLQVRVLPLIAAHAAQHGRVPPAMVLGFAAHLRFMRGDLHAARRNAGHSVPRDDHSARFASLWSEIGSSSREAVLRLAATVCADRTLWNGTDLTAIPGFVPAVAEQLIALLRGGVDAALEAHRSGVAAVA